MTILDERPLDGRQINETRLNGTRLNETRLNGTRQGRHPGRGLVAAPARRPVRPGPVRPPGERR